MISFREILKGTITRFVPGAIIGQGLMIALLLIGEPAPLQWRDFLVLGGFTATLAAGHLGALSAMRRFMRSDADVAGRRAMISGLAAGAFHFGTAAYLDTLTVTNGYVLGVFAGAAAAFSLFFPWLQSRQSGAEPSMVPGVLDELALAESSDLDWPARREDAPERVKYRTPQ